jgi:hypothetical protein
MHLNVSGNKPECNSSNKIRVFPKNKLNNHSFWCVYLMCKMHCSFSGMINVIVN